MNPFSGSVVMLQENINDVTEFRAPVGNELTLRCNSTEYGLFTIIFRILLCTIVLIFGLSFEKRKDLTLSEA